MRKVYLDHCVNCGLTTAGGEQWQTIGVGKVLDQAIRDKTAEVWTSPTEVLETFLWADFDGDGKVIDSDKLDLRMTCAKNTLEMIEAKRMAASFEFIVVGDFLTVLDTAAPGAVLTREYFKLEQTNNQRLFVGILGLLGAYRRLDRPDAITDLIRTKITTRLLHSRFLTDPDRFVEAVIDTAANFRVTSDDIFAAYDRRTLDDLRREIEANEQLAISLTPVARNRLMKNKAMIAASYGAAELGECLTSVFSDFSRCLMTFDISVIKRHWSDLTNMLGEPSVPFPGPADDEECIGNYTVLADALSVLFRRFARHRLLVAKIAPLVALGEIEMCLNKNALPAGSGLTFDCTHAAMLTRTNIFVTHDERLATLARRAISIIESIDPSHEIVVVRNAGELEHALQKPSKV